MTFDLDDTIVAIASAPGGALRGIVRLSGPSSAASVVSIFRAGGDGFTVRAASVFNGELLLPRDLGSIPARLYWWPDSRSYTRQPSAELHTLGSPPLLEAVLQSLCAAGARLARPGEFTLRAFLAGRLDLTQAEAVLGVIDARGAAQLETALSQLAGGLAQPLHVLRSKLLDLLAHLEAGLDFVEEDIEFISAGDLAAQLADAAGEVARLAGQMRERNDAAELPRVVLIGEPNAGKSTLFNALIAREAAIVSDEAGTTRDYVACRMSLAGQEFLLVDTAGVNAGGIDTRATNSSIAGEAQRATDRQKRAADITILCVDASQFDVGTGDERAADLVVWTKCDRRLPAPSDALRTSSRTRAGLDELKSAIASRLREQHADAVVSSTAARCGESLGLAASALSRARELVQQMAGEELVAAEVRAALDGLGQVAGTVYTDDVLDRVFSRFCIGK